MNGTSAIIECNPFTVSSYYNRTVFSDESEIMNCAFQTNDSTKTMCEWVSSVPAGVKVLVDSGRLERDMVADWRIESSGESTGCCFDSFRWFPPPTSIKTLLLYQVVTSGVGGLR